MKAVLPLRNAILLCATVLLSLTFTSWQDRAPQAEKNTHDTVPPKPEKKIRDLDEALEEIDDAHADLDKSMKEIDWKKVNADIKDAMKHLDKDLKQMNADLKKSLQEIDVAKMRHDVEASVAKIDWEGLKQQLEKVKEIDMTGVKNQLESVKTEMEKLQPQLERSMAQAREGIERAKTELQGYKSFVDGLERDGLINKKEGYTIEHKNGQLIINGKQQPADVYNKYRTFLEKNKTFTLKQNDDDLKINNE
jgi:exonuclease VII small subunit